VRSASQEMTDGNKHILSEIQQLKLSTDAIKDSMNGMHAGADRINETGSALSEISGKVADNVRQIGSEIDPLRYSLFVKIGESKIRLAPIGRAAQPLRNEVEQWRG
ncbi:MAG: hypothetical protein II110_08980, partial [Treponema sp.]|nr:hypothetical protein [Treponema sp.]